MRYLNKVIFLNSAHIPYAEIRMDGNVHFIGTQGVGKSTLLRAILFFYNADKLHLGIPKEKQNFDAFYLPYANSYIVYEVVRENSAYSVVVSKSMGRAAFRLIDAPYRKAWFVNDRHEVSADWSEVRTRILESDARCTITPLVTSYEMFRDIIFGNNRKPDMVSYRKFAIVESSKYQNIPRTIQHVFLNSRLDADFVKDTIIQSMNEEDVSIDLTYYRSQIEAFEQEYDDVMRWLRPNKNGEIVVRKQAEQVIQRYRSLLYSQKQLEEGRAELNYAEKAAHDMLPVLEEQIQEAEEKRARLVRLVGEERGKYSAERDKLVRREGAIADDLKRIREKRLYYEKEGIENDQIYKPYTSAIYEDNNGGKRKVDDILDVEFLLTKDNKGEVMYWGWYTISCLKGQMKPKNIARGIRLRKENIQIGDEEICKKFFTKTEDQRFSFYYFGEIHALSKGLDSNSRRLF